MSIDRIRLAREPPVPAVRGVDCAGQRQARRLRGAERRGRARLHGLLGAPRARKPAWHKPFTQVLDESNAPFYKWFADGELNASYNCLDRNLENGNADKIAIIFEADDGKVTKVTYRELHRARLPVSPTGSSRWASRRATASSSTCRCRSRAWSRCRPARASARPTRWCSAASRRSRCRSASSTPARVAVITADEQMRGGKALPLKAIVDEALGLGGCEARQQRRSCTGAPATPCDMAARARRVVARPASPSQADTLRAGRGSTPSIRCSSSTPRAPPASPRACSTRPAATCCGPALTMKWAFDIKPTDVFWCTADIGWVTGHTYIAYGPLAAGATEVMFEGVPTYPERRPLLGDDPAPQGQRLLHRADGDPLADQGSPTAIRPCTRRSTTSSSLRLLGTVGEPINPEAWMWYYNNVGGERCPIVDTLWQTETGGHMITPLPGATPLVPGSCTLPLPGIMAAIVDETGHDVPNGQGRHAGHQAALAVDDPHDLGRPRALQEVLLPRGARRQALPRRRRRGARCRDAATSRIMGRIDDVLNVSGHRMGTMEIESALVANPMVAEAAVVGRPDDMTGEAICAFVVLKRARPTGDEAQEDRQASCATGSARRSARSPSPRTSASATTCRRRARARSCAGCCARSPRAKTITQDVSTLENPAILEQLKQSA